MKSKLSSCLILLTLCTSLVLPGRGAAQERGELKSSETDHPRYRFRDVGSFGGPVSYLANDATGTGSGSGVLNRSGSIVSGADTSISNPNYPNVCLLCAPDPLVVHAFRWQNGHLADLGALPGSNNSFANWISTNGLIAGYSETGQIDRLLGLPAIDAVLWKHVQIIDLGTIEGGYESAAFAVNNNRREVVGGFVNTIQDPYSPFGLQVRAFLWQDGVMRDLGTLGGPDATAYFINDSGQVAGNAFTDYSANAVTGLPTQDPFLWENGVMLDLGTLGGTFGIANYLDNRGRVIGQSNVAGDLSQHPFLWTKAQGMPDLGTLGGSFGQANWMNDAGEIVGFARTEGDRALLAFLWEDNILTKLGAVKGDACSNALGINSKRQVVGVSAKTCAFTAAERHAFLWEEGHMTDLNIFLPPGTGLQQLTDAYNINDHGEITGLAVPLGCSDEFACGHVFVLSPCQDESSKGCTEPDQITPAATEDGSSHTGQTGQS